MMKQKSKDQIIEEWLVLNSQNGDKKAFELLFIRLNPLLQRHGLRLIGNEEQLADVLQDTWLAIVRSIKKLQDPTKIRSFALRILTFKAADAIRRWQKSRNYTQTDNLDGIVEETEHDSELDVLGNQLTKYIKKLTKQQQLIIRLHYLEDLSLNDIGEILDIPTGTVKSRLFTARNQLKKLLESKL